MKNNVTELVFILDKSGSMYGLEKDTVGGFNSLIEKQKKEEGKCYVSTVLFSDDSTVVHDREELSKVSRMTESDYCVGGCTALLDAVGDAVHHVENIHKYARSEDVPEHTVIVIMTDGMENASRRYTPEKVKKAIIRAKEERGWEFIFLGANIDAALVAKDFGIESERAVDYHSDSKGTKLNYDVMSEAICSVRACGTMPIGWRGRIDRDYEERKKR